MSGQGLIETIRIINSGIPFRQLHIDRLYRSLQMSGIKITLNETEAQFDKIIEQTQEIYSSDNLRLRIEVRLHQQKLIWHFNSSGLNDAGFILNEIPLNLTIFKDNYKTIHDFCNLKSTDRLIYDEAKAFATKNSFDDALILNTDRTIADATIFNVFMVKDNQVYTPRLSDAPIDGVLRRFLLNTVSSYPIIEQAITQEAILSADEIFLTNAVRGIRQVGRINDVSLKNDITKQIFNEFIVKVSNFNHQIQ